VVFERDTITNGVFVHDVDVGNGMCASAVNELDVGAVYRCEEGRRRGGPEGYDV
jgi:hypothetical protein